MTKLLCAVLLLAVPTGVCSAGVRPWSEEWSLVMDRYGRGEVAAGDWLIEMRDMRLLPIEGPITGLAFGPGRKELAYCTDGPEAGSALWIAPIPDADEWELAEGNLLPVRPRLLWQAPSGTHLTHPIWWAPTGGSIAVLTQDAGSQSIVSVDYASGAATVLANHLRICAAAFDPSAEHLAYVTDDQGERSVYHSRIQALSVHRLGPGGINLRWSLDGVLRWFEARPDGGWSEWTWAPDRESAENTGGVPPRPEGAVWSPNGLLCAALEQADDGTRQLVLRRAPSNLKHVISLEGVTVERLLGWSPDSALVLVLLRSDCLFAVSAQSPGDALIQFLTARSAGLRPSELDRPALLMGWPVVEPAAGPPTWSSDGALLAYVAASKEATQRATGYAGRMEPYGRIVLLSFGRRYFRPPTDEERELEQLDSNTKNIALALQMYLADNNDVFPLAEDTDQLRAVLDEYVHTQGIFMRPGTTDEVVVRYLVPPGLNWREVRDTAAMPVAVIDYHPRYCFIAYGDGHVERFGKDPGYQEHWQSWWREYHAQRGEAE